MKHASKHQALRHPNARPARGVAMIEALVALLVMSFGMVAVAGLLGTMRRSADLAKQRGEAMRLAQAEMERLRDFSVLTAPSPRDFADQRDFTGDIPVQADPAAVQVGDDLNSNASYQMTRRVTAVADPPYKAVRLTISWIDRANDPQFVITDTFIAQAEPGLGGSLRSPPQYGASRRARDGNSVLPPGAKDLGDGTSVLKVPGSGTLVAYVFNNLTGVITSQCAVSSGSTTQSLTASALTSCSSVDLFALWGFVRFADAEPLNASTLAGSLAASYAQPLDMLIADSSVAGAPVAPAHTCYDNAPVSAADGTTLQQTAVSYFCVVTPGATVISTSPTVTANAWTGKLNTGTIPLGAGHWKICRYSGNYDGNGSISNAEHPLIYTNVLGGLGNQNFLAIKHAQSCPTGTGTPGTSAFFSTATVAHQPDGVATTP